MNTRVDRRRFLGRCIACSAGASMLAAAERPAAAIDPIPRDGQPKFKFSLAAYSYRKLLSGDDPALSLFDFIDDCASMGLEGTELTSYYFPSPVSHEYLRELKRHCFRLGLDISGTAVGNDFGNVDEAAHQEQIQHVKRWVDYAEILGAPVIRIFAGRVRKEQTPEQAHRQMVAAMEQCCEYAGQHGVHLALENHGGPTGTVDGLLALVRDVQSPWFGVNLDTGNFHSDDAYGDIEKAAPYAVNVQVKVVIADSQGGHQPADFKRLAGILRNGGYRGYVVLEYEEDKDPRQQSRIAIDRLREAFA